MPTLDWINRADAFTTAQRVPYRLLELVSAHTATGAPHHADLIQTPLLVFGESVRIGPARLAAAGVTFRQIPYDVKAR